MQNILPIGSIVRLKNGQEKLMILNRAPLFNNEGVLGYFEYSACIYPNGQTGQNVFFFNEEDIEEVLFEGFKDADEETFCDTFNEKIEKTPYPKFHVMTEDGKGESS